MGKNKGNRKGRFYTRHGQKIYLGKLVKVHGERSIGYFDGDEIVAYSTLEEIREMSYSQELEDYNPDF